MEPAERKSMLSFLKHEFVTLGIEHWRSFYPVKAAVWQFVEAERRGALGTMRSGFADGELYFEGKNADWFLNSLFEQDEVLTIAEEISYPAFDALPHSALDRGFLIAREVPEWERALRPDVADRLAALVLAQVDDAVRDGELT